MERNKVKPDTILKNFWRDNHHFADLFNAALFDGEQVLNPDDLSEADTDLSSIIKFNGHAETVQKVLDVVKKTAYGLDFVIWGLENQERIHYAMPLRHMIGDAFSYLKEYNEIAAKNRKDKDFTTSDEFLSNMKKTDRLHPVISLCVYYGENPWDGPLCLMDMLEIPDKIRTLVSDYKMNLIELRTSGALKFHDSDVNTVFDISRSIYERNYGRLNTVYKEREISSELGVVIGAITQSQRLINQALEMEEKGGRMNMCSALEEIEKEGMIAGAIKTCKNFNISKDDAIRNLIKQFSLSEEDAVSYVEKYW